MNKRSLTRKLRSQYGFTLLELLVVIAVIGVLASLAVPRMQNQIQRAKFVDVVNATAPYKTAVEMCFLQNSQSLTGCVGGAHGIPADTAANASAIGVVASVKTGVATNSGNGNASTAQDGQIVATGTSAVGGYTYTLTPTNNNGALTWAVGGTCQAANVC